MISFLILCLIWGAIWGAVCVAIGHSKDSAAGSSTASDFWLGFFLGIIGVIIVACRKPYAPLGMWPVKCPRCNAAQNVQQGAPGYSCWQCQYHVTFLPRA